jgi:hypothetical protein
MLSSDNTSLISVLAPILVHHANPILDQMVTGSAFQSEINSRGNAFPVAGIQNRAWDRWTEFRLWGDSRRCGNVVVDCGDGGGRSYVQTADKSYHLFIKCAVVSSMFGFVWPGAWRVARACGFGAAALRTVDLQYRALSVGNSHGDGIVPEWSQYFPGAAPNAQFLADDSDSHLGETSSGRYTGGRITEAMRSTFGVPLAH